MPGTPIGCVTAQAMCCGGTIPQCMLGRDDNDNVQNTASGIGQIRVPCGVNVVGTYGSTCNRADQYNARPPSDGNLSLLTGDSSQTTVYPYAFQVGLQQGFHCASDGNVRTVDKNEIPQCGSFNPGVHAPPSPDNSDSSNNAGGLSRAQMLIILAVVLLLVIIVHKYSQKNTKKKTLSVDQIIEASGMNEKLALPTTDPTGAPTPTDNVPSPSND